MNSKSTKRALMSSVVALVLCFAMLLGTTYAWFTDSAVSTGNKIVSGTLDIELQQWKTPDGETEPKYVNIGDDKTPIFSDTILWEPGMTQVAYLRIENKGNLDLKYKVAINTSIVDPDNFDVNVLEAMEYAIIPDAVAGDVDSWDYVGVDVVLGSNDTQATDVLLGAGKNHCFALAVHMKEDAGNEFMNAQIAFDILVLAGQVASESDSFNNQYDASATYLTPVNNTAELFAAIDRGEDVAVEEPIVIDAVFMSELQRRNANNSSSTFALTRNAQVIDRSGVLDFNGITVHRIKPEATTDEKPVIIISSGIDVAFENVTVDGGADWSGAIDPVLNRGTTNTGIKTTQPIIQINGNANVVLGENVVLQNNDGNSAVSLATRGGGSLTLNGAKIINNVSAGGAAIWGGDDITINEGTVISGNYATSIGGAIRMVNGYNAITFTMNGGQINNNASAGTGGAIWGGNSATYNFNGGEMAYNYAAVAGGAIWTGNYETYNISGDFKMHDNAAEELGGAIRFTDHAALNMTGGEVYNNTVAGNSNAFYLNNNSATFAGGIVADDFSYSGGLGLTDGLADIDGVISFSLGTNHNTVYLAKDFNGFKFTVNEANANFNKFNFKPAADYVYTAGDEAKFICMNEGYVTYWDAETSTFRLNASN